MIFVPAPTFLGAGAAAFVGLLDTYPTAAFAFSFRKLRNAYAGSAVRIRESGGDTEADIGFDIDGNFDAAAAATHIGGGSGFIVTWYDQSGNGLDVTQATAANQPAYLASGINSAPAMDFDGGNDELTRASFANTSFGTGTEYSYFRVVRFDSTDATPNCSLGWNIGNTSNRVFMADAWNDDNVYNDWGSNAGGRLAVTEPAGVEGGAEFIVESYRDSSDEQGTAYNGVSAGTATKTDDISAATATLFVGSHGAGDNFNGRMVELVLWGTDLGTTDRGGVTTNMNAYYTVF